MTTDTDRKFIANPNAWPRWPVLPVTRYTAKAGHEVAIIMENGGGKFRIARGHNMWDEVPASKFDFITIDEIVEEGWEVD